MTRTTTRPPLGVATVDAPARHWQARAFGSQPADLDGRPGQGTAHDAVTMLLAACLRDDQGRPPGADMLATWPLARRLRSLVDVRLADDPAARLAVVARCAGCAAGFEIDLELALCQVDVDAAPLTWSSPDGRFLTVRLPTAADLLAWQVQGLHDSAQIAGALVETVDGVPPARGFVLPSDWADPLADALSQRDPLTAMSVVAACPECGQVNRTAIDLQGHLLEGFEARQRELLDEVAQLAAAFHWNEAQILALPAWRRTHYLARVDAMGAR